MYVNAKSAMGEGQEVPLSRDPLADPVSATNIGPCLNFAIVDFL